MSIVRSVLCWIMAAFFLAAGANHFRAPEIYPPMMPSWVPSPATVNVIVGAAEVLGALGLVFRPTRRLAGWGLMVLLVAIFPSNVHVALLGKMPGFDFSPLTLWLRLPLQAVLIAWVWWAAVKRTREEKQSRWS